MVCGTEGSEFEGSVVCRPISYTPYRYSVLSKDPGWLAFGLYSAHAHRVVVKTETEINAIWAHESQGLVRSNQRVPRELNIVLEVSTRSIKLPGSCGPRRSRETSRSARKWSKENSHVSTRIASNRAQTRVRMCESSPDVHAMRITCLDRLLKISTPQIATREKEEASKKNHSSVRWHGFDKVAVTGLMELKGDRTAAMSQHRELRRKDNSGSSKAVEQDE
ncbi:hypothetical protein CRG98_007703 [Punica granatum]|uniref:Uncharacterized protein n=1 Tax=Punica granatum TaxID=22663 RepID=A0A2I0KTY7_PUNGR|nr:hypothetical protein CRG98_007703 [Punica granatum]